MEIDDKMVEAAYSAFVSAPGSDKSAMRAALTAALATIQAPAGAEAVAEQELPYRCDVCCTPGYYAKNAKCLCDPAPLPAAEAVVKPLEWEYHERPVRTYTAYDDRGLLYYINQAFGSDSYYFTTQCFNGATLYDGDDLPSAKAAAQADYEARIRSALVAPASLPDGWELVREIIAAWEALPGGQQQSVRRVERWLAEDMKPVIDKARRDVPAAPAIAKGE